MCTSLEADRHVNLIPTQDAVEWLIADQKSGVDDLDGAIQVSQRFEKIESPAVLLRSR